MAETATPKTGKKSFGKTKKMLGDATFSPGWLMMMFIMGSAELMELVLSPLNFTGIWEVLNWIVDGIVLLIYVGWRVSKKGLSFSSIVGDKKSAIILILEHLPFIEDIFPGFIIQMWRLRKEKPFKG